MARNLGKFERKAKQLKRPAFFAMIPLFFFLTELFAWSHLKTVGMDLWPLIFGILWAVILTGVLSVLPRNVSRIAFGLLFAASMVYSVGQTGYYLLFSEMMWLSEFRYANEGADYLDIILNYPPEWFLEILLLLVLGVFLLVRYPEREGRAPEKIAAGALAVVATLCALWLPQIVFLEDDDIRYAGSDYGRAQSAEAAYENMFNPHRLYQVCGLYQMAARDIYVNGIYPHTPAYAAAQEEAETKIDAWFAKRQTGGKNEMTGIFAGKNVVLVLMESMDDWLLGAHTPTINALMAEGIHFTRFYTPPYGGIRTFNTEFCINTGNFLSSQGGYAFDYVTNTFNQSLPSILADAGYSAKVFHYNKPGFYSRGVFSEAMGYEEYVCYEDYLQNVNSATRKQLLYDDLLLFDNASLNGLFFRDEGPTLNFVITRSAHLSYKYNEVLSHWGLKKYPEFRGMTGNEEEDCAYLKARLVDDFFARLLQELEVHGRLEDTIIIGVTDHYTYGVKDEALMLDRSGVNHKLWLERTPCFIWSADGESMTVDKTLNTADFLPTLLNLLGVEPEQNYMGRDAFDDSYPGFVPFSDGSWISGDVAYSASDGKLLYLTDTAEPVTAQFRKEISAMVKEFTGINNLILDADYYKALEEE